MQHLFDAGGFLVCFPLYLLEHRSGVYKFLISPPPDGDIATPIFTDEDAARTFLEKGPTAEEYSLKCIAEPLALLGLLTVLETKGFTHVTFDPVGSKATSLTIPALRAYAFRWSDQDATPQA